MEAVRDRAAGKSRVEIRDLLAAEYESRNTGVPSPAVLDALADVIAGRARPGSSAWSSARSLLTIARAIAATRKELRETLGIGKIGRDWSRSGGSTYGSPGHAGFWVTVLLDPGAEQVLDVSWMPAPVAVRVEAQQDSQDGPADPRQITVMVRGQRVGVLGQQDSVRYRPALEALGRPVTVQGSESRADGGAVHLEIFLPDDLTEGAPVFGE
jgi:hypothetical protein